MQQISIERIWVTTSAGAHDRRVEVELQDARRCGLVVGLPCTETLSSGRAAGSDVWHMAIGSSEEDQELRHRVGLYVHVGPTHLDRKIGVTVPLIGQGIEGTLNAIRWAIATRREGWAWPDHKDIADFAQSCVGSYSRDQRSAEVEMYARSAATEIAERFPIMCVLGTGYPFYTMVSAAVRDHARLPAPKSIRHYVRVQADDFASVLLDGKDVDPDASADASGLSPRRSAFSLYEWTRWKAAPPHAPAGASIREHIERNTLDVRDRLWPCALCTELSDPAKYETARPRDFMETCASCGQTPYLPRAVGVLGADIDLVALVDTESEDELRNLASSVVRWIDGHKRWYRHDTRWPAHLRSSHGPLDVFLVSRQGFFQSVRAMATPDEGWSAVTVPAIVTWLPPTRIDYGVGKYMPLCMEFLASSDPTCESELIEARQRFASAVGIEQIASVYARSEPYLSQLIGNDAVREIISARLMRWKAGQI